MSVSDALAPWAVRAALAGLPEDQARELLESDRYPEPNPHEERWEAETESVCLGEDGQRGEVIVYNTENEQAWVQSTSAVPLEEIQ